MTLSPLWLLASGGGLLLIGMVIGFWLGIANEKGEAEIRREYRKHVVAACDAQFDEIYNEWLLSNPPVVHHHPLRHETRRWTLAELIGTKIVEVSE